jgi:hypothetical protein
MTMTVTIATGFPSVSVIFPTNLPRDDWAVTYDDPTTINPARAIDSLRKIGNILDIVGRQNQRLPMLLAHIAANNKKILKT